jgi:TRAP-type C4-dicarboxylate transport system substrate-binding protein
MRAKPTLLALAVAASVLCALPPARAETTLRLLSGWTPNNPNVPLIEAVYIKNVEAASNGEIKIKRSGPEVAPPFEQLQPVSAGVFDFLFTTPGYHQAQTGVGNILDTVTGDLAKRRQSGLVEWADGFYNKHYGLRIIALHPAPGNHFVLREPLGPDGTLKGLKVRSNAAFDGIVRQLGGTPVNMSPADAYSAMQKGVLDGITFPVFASSDYKLYEVGKYMTRPVFGLSNVMLMMNSKKLESLPPNLQRILIEEGKKIEDIGTQALIQVAVKDEATMQANGVKIIQLAPSIAPKLNEMYNEGIFQTASRTTPDDVKALWELAKSKNMLNQ